jgi:hypothetical protein
MHPEGMLQDVVADQPAETARGSGVPVELVRRVTGHATVEVVLKHYFRPDREQFRTAMRDGLPTMLTGEGGEAGRGKAEGGSDQSSVNSQQ